jgi:hypothetical protein
MERLLGNNLGNNMEIIVKKSWNNRGKIVTIMMEIVKKKYCQYNGGNNSGNKQGRVPFR